MVQGYHEYRLQGFFGSFSVWVVFRARLVPLMKGVMNNSVARWSLTATIGFGIAAASLFVAPAEAQAENCVRATQNQIAWNYKGNKRWAKKNLDRLCRNSRNAQPARCFKKAMHGGINWGGGTQWKWENAINLCEQSTNASATIACFQKKVGKAGWNKAIAACDERAPKVDCKASVQNKIAWDYKGTKRWAPKNLNRLCKGVQGDEPAKCFRKVMHGGINWGGGTQWKWENAIDLCERSTDAARTVRCFKKRLKRGKQWKKAIAACDERRG